MCRQLSALFAGLTARRDTFPAKCVEIGHGHQFDMLLPAQLRPEGDCIRIVLTDEQVPFLNSILHQVIEAAACQHAPDAQPAVR